VSPTSEALVRDLLRPDAYPAPRPRGVELRTTHASWVFLTDDDVWKVKRPVALGFLDHRDVDVRHARCDDEVRLNARLAPDVYRGVVPVRRGPLGHTLSPEGGALPIADWAVRMRRLPDAWSAASRLGLGRLDAGQLAALARRLATFFATSPPRPGAADVAALAAAVEENFAEVSEAVGDLVDEATFIETRAFQRACLRARADRFEARRARAVDGHGDLRLEHVYFEPDADGERPLVIDCIEFNDRFRCGDPAGEVAFLAMELEAARRPDLAAGFLARYAEAASDVDLYGVLDFYLSYRAWVRGKVAALVARDAGVETALRAAKREEARRLFGLARAAAGRPLDGPFIVAVSGLPGTGKSTLARALGEALAAPVVGSDQTRKALAGLAPLDAGGDELYTPARTEATYAELRRAAEVVVASGRGVVLDATFGRRAHRAAAAALAARLGAPLVLLEATCPDEAALRARLARRVGRPCESDARERELALARAAAEPFASDEPLARIVLDTRSSPQATLVRALEALRPAGVVPAGERWRS
jgi:aminoglycoside phosphotransferase family enzyme/predicted kinase